MRPAEEQPVPTVPETYLPPSARRHPVAANETWVTIARGLSMDPWDLIDFNFPGIKQAKQKDAQKAARHVNWYLREYVGCQTSTDGENWAFSSGLTKGRGGWKGGHIFLPPKSPPPPKAVAPPHCTTIQIPPIDTLPSTVRLVLHALKVQLPTQARCLDPAERKVAENVYEKSLVYDDIFISDGAGLSGRAVTTAVPMGSRWIVLLNMGPGGFTTSHATSNQATLIHELVHAWQSQHHPKPWQYMINCAKSQVEAELATAAAAVNSNKWIRLAGRLAGGGGVPDFKLGEASAYAYIPIPGKTFGDYAGEQVAMLVEDSQFPYLAGINGNAAATTLTTAAWNHVKSVAPRAHDSENVRSLSTTRYVHKNFQGVVWHK